MGHPRACHILSVEHIYKKPTHCESPLWMRLRSWSAIRWGDSVAISIFAADSFTVLLAEL